MRQRTTLRTGMWLAALGLMGLTGPAAHAQSQLGIYTFTGAAGNEPTFPVDTQPTNATFSPMRRGSGVTPPSAGSMGRFAATDFSMDSTVADTADYFAFRLMAASGFRLNLDSLVFTERRSSTGIHKWEVRTSLDNYTAAVKTLSVPDDTNSRRTLVDLTGAAFSTPTMIEFRIYGYGAEGAAGTWRLDDVKVLGAVEAAGPASPTVSFAPVSQTVTEGAGTIQIPVAIASASATAATTVEVMVSGGSATQGTDYTVVAGTLTFAAGSTAAQNVALTILDDTQAESAETVTLMLMNVSTGALIGADTYTLTITDNDGVAPVVPPLQTIAAVTTNDAQGSPLQNGQAVRIRGIAISPNVRTAGYQMALQDRTGGVTLFKTANIGTQTISQGDSLEVVGVVTLFNGLTEITIDSFRTLLTNQMLPTPRVVTVLDETAESELVKINTPLTIVDPTQWTGTGSGFNVDVTDGTTTYQMRVVRGTDLYTAPVPTMAFRLTGVGGQFDNTAPYDGGYQITPRALTDLDFVTGVVAEAVAVAPVQLYPNPATDRLTIAASGSAVTIYDALGRTVRLADLNGAATTISVAELPAGIYSVQVGSSVRRFVKQ